MARPLISSPLPAFSALYSSNRALQEGRIWPKFFFRTRILRGTFSVWPNVIVSCSCSQLVNPASRPFENFLSGQPGGSRGLGRCMPEARWPARAEDACRTARLHGDSRGAYRA